jgi:uncharacterized membrane protein (UPF0127 family)
MAWPAKLIVNVTRGNAVCVGEVADRPLRRMRGLIGRRGLPAGEGMLLSPAPGIHTAFMRFSIDALFLDGNMRVVDIVERLRPWRVASRRNARAVLELAAGECARNGIEVGDRLGVRERRPVDSGQDNVARFARKDASGRRVPSDSVIWPAPLASEQGRVERNAATRVLVISRDRHFRSVVSMLLAHRGCSVTTTAKVERVAEMIARDGADVVVIDAGDSPGTSQAVAAVGALAQPVGIVIVDDSPVGEQPASVLPKWGPFEDLYSAIERAGRTRSRSGERA